jgi:pimeloyl-ACP methyl ester carboxylesterase
VPLARTPEYVLAWLDALGLDWAHVAAHSLGGYTALALAAAHPAQVGRLALVAPAALPVRLGETMRPGLIPATVAPRFLPVLARDSLRTGPRRLLRTLRELLAAEPLPLEAVRAPTLILWGARDPLLPPAHGRELARRLPDARLCLLPDAGHIPMYESPAACHAALIRFLSEAS